MESLPEDVQARIPDALERIGKADRRQHPRK
jgi:hypothetical protein